ADPGAARAVDARLDAAGVRRRHRIIVVHVSAGNPFRRWPIEAFSVLVGTLAARDADRRIVVTSGPADRQAGAQVISTGGAALGGIEQERVVMCGDLSLAELRALFDRAALYIGGDSGPMHVAATSAVPIVALYGPTLPARSEPWRSPHLVTE